MGELFPEPAAPSTPGPSAAPAPAPERKKAPTREGRCKLCKTPVVFMQMPASGKLNPLDPQVLSIINEFGEVVRGRESHFARCPEAIKFRRSR